MVDYFSYFPVPSSLLQFKKIIADNVETTNQFMTDIEVQRNTRGAIEVVSYFAEKFLIKKIFYDNAEVVKIENYVLGKLESTDEYEETRLSKKIMYNTHNEKVCEIKYNYDPIGRIINIQKVNRNINAIVNYVYDDLDRIIERSVIIDDQSILKQKYAYDILNRIIMYEDEEQKINVSKVSQDNELLSYSITDVHGNEMYVENYFVRNTYHSSKITLNGHKATINDIAYVDNFCLKQPLPNLVDLEIFVTKCISQECTKDSSDAEKQKENMKNVTVLPNMKQATVLPISMRKLYLYKLVANC